MWRWYEGRGLLTELCFCYSIVYYYNSAQWYEQFVQVSRLDRSLILLGCLYLLSSSVSSVFMMLCIYWNFLSYILYFTFQWAEPDGIGWLTIVLQCYDSVGWIIIQTHKIVPQNDSYCVEWDIKPYCKFTNGGCSVSALMTYVGHRPAHILVQNRQDRPRGFYRVGQKVRKNFEFFTISRLYVHISQKLLKIQAYKQHMEKSFISPLSKCRMCLDHRSRRSIGWAKKWVT